MVAGGRAARAPPPAPMTSAEAFDEPGAAAASHMPVVRAPGYIWVSSWPPSFGLLAATALTT